MQYTEELILQKAQAAFDHGDAVFAVNRNTCALLVIDMQDEFVKPGWTSSWIPEATRQVPRIKRLITYCRQTGIPVIYTVFSATHGYLDRPRYGSAMPNRFPDLGQDPRWFKQGKIWDELAPLPHDIVIHKASYGAFYDTPLETILKNSGKDTLIISGTLTNCCCGTTARQAYERGYKVIFGSDITSTYTEEMQRAELGILRFAFAKVMRAEDIIACLEQGGEPRPPDSFLLSEPGSLS